MVYFVCGLLWFVGAIIFLVSGLLKIKRFDMIGGVGYILISVIYTCISVMFFYFYVYY